jgi:hypothetical protein
MIVTLTRHLEFRFFQTEIRSWSWTGFRISRSQSVLAHIAMVVQQDAEVPVRGV